MKYVLYFLMHIMLHTFGSTVSVFADYNKIVASRDHLSLAFAVSFGYDSNNIYLCN